MIDHARPAELVLATGTPPAQRTAGSSHRGEWQVIHAEGELDVACESRLRSLIAAAGPRVVLDLSRVTFMDASSLGVLASAGERARLAGGAVRLVGASRQVRRIVTLTELDGVLPMFDTVQEALDDTMAPSRPSHDVARRPGR